MPDHSILSGLRVLVIEDDVLITMLIEDFLDELGSQVVGPASTGVEAANLIATAAIDVALLDFHLGGGETTGQLASQLGDRGVPFAFVTGLDMQSSRDQFKNSPLLRKPFRVDDLERLLIDLIESRS